MTRVLTRIVLTGAMTLLGFLSGCKSGTEASYIYDMYGMPPPSEHPTVRLTDFSYTPASPIYIGDTLVLTAVTNEPTTTASMHAYLPATVTKYVELQDDGQPPDETAGDGTWTAELVWTEELGAVEDKNVQAELSFNGRYNSQHIWQPLTVLTEEEE